MRSGCPWRPCRSIDCAQYGPVGCHERPAETRPPALPVERHSRVRSVSFAAGILVVFTAAGAVESAPLWTVLALGFVGFILLAWGGAE